MQVTLPYVGHLDDCSKCGGNAHKVSYRAPESDGFEQEHLLYTCETCGYEHRRLTRHNTPPDPHPDDFMLITIEVDFQAKVNPDSKEPMPVDGCGPMQYSLPADPNTADYLEGIAKAIRERRLYGWLQQECAEMPVSTEEWISSFDGADVTPKTKGADPKVVYPKWRKPAKHDGDDDEKKK